MNHTKKSYIVYGAFCLTGYWALWVAEPEFQRFLGFLADLALGVQDSGFAFLFQTVVRAAGLVEFSVLGFRFGFKMEA